MRELPEQQRSQERLIRFDEQIVADASFEDLDPALVDQFRTPRTGDDRRTLARKLAIVTPDDAGELVPTVAGLLISARNPERWLPHAFIQAVAYRGQSVSESLGSPYYQLDARGHRGTAGHAGNRRLPLCHEEPEGGGAQDYGPY